MKKRTWNHRGIDWKDPDQARLYRANWMRAKRKRERMDFAIVFGIRVRTNLMAEVAR